VGIAGKVQANERDKLKLANAGKFGLYLFVRPRKSIFLSFAYNSSVQFRFYQQFRLFYLHTVGNSVVSSAIWKKHDCQNCACPKDKCMYVFPNCTRNHILLLRPKICGFPVSRPYLAFGRRNPDPKLFYWIMLVSVST
jgi:hypothetical protein